jgi:hypothetical protein
MCAQINIHANHVNKGIIWMNQKIIHVNVNILFIYQSINYQIK